MLQNAKGVATKASAFLEWAKGVDQLGFKTCSTLDVCSGVVCVCFPCARARVCEHVRAPVRADARVPCVPGGRTACEVFLSLCRNPLRRLPAFSSTFSLKLLLLLQECQHNPNDTGSRDGDIRAFRVVSTRMSESERDFSELDFF